KNQPADGPAPAPPTDVGMSVTIASPPCPSTRTRSPSSRVAVATESVYRASSGWPVRYSVAARTARRMVCAVMWGSRPRRPAQSAVIGQLDGVLGRSRAADFGISTSGDRANRSEGCCRIRAGDHVDIRTLYPGAVTDLRQSA